MKRPTRTQYVRTRPRLRGARSSARRDRRKHRPGMGRSRRRQRPYRREALRSNLLRPSRNRPARDSRAIPPLKTSRSHPTQRMKRRASRRRPRTSRPQHAKRRPRRPHRPSMRRANAAAQKEPGPPSHAPRSIQRGLSAGSVERSRPRTSEGGDRSRSASARRSSVRCEFRSR